MTRPAIWCCDPPGKGAAIVSLHAVHAIVTASSDPALREAVNTFQIVATDGQPVRWALNLLHKTQLRQRVYGPELMLRLCRRAAAEEVPIYLYGSAPEVIEALTANLRNKFSGLRIAGAKHRLSDPCRPKKRTKRFGASTPAAPRSFSSGSVIRSKTTLPIDIAGGFEPSRCASGRPSTSMREPTGWPRGGCSATASNGSSAYARNRGAFGTDTWLPTPFF